MPTGVYLRTEPIWNKGLLCEKHFCPKCGKEKSLQAKLCIECFTVWNKGLKGIHISPLSEFKKGCLSPMKGKRHSKESRLKMSLSRKGKKHPCKWVVHTSWFKKGVAQNKGSKHWNWKGGISSQDRLERNKFRNTIQKLVFERDNYTCQICHQKGGDLQVDHIKSWASNPDLRFLLANCRTLCIHCHYMVTFGRKMPYNIKGWGHNLLERERINIFH